jgi:hypothetical protein
MINGALLGHLKGRRARLDRKDRFIYVPCPKAMSGTIDMLLGMRGVHQKMGSKIYKELKPHFRKSEYDETLTRYGKLDRERVFIFTFVRNPWDRILSAVSYIRGMKIKGSGVKVPSHVTKERFSKFVVGPLSEHGPGLYGDFREQHPSFEMEGDRFADFIGTYEAFEQDWRWLSKEIGLPEPSAMPHARRSKHSDYRRYYTDAAIEAVAKLYARDIEALGYKF